MASHSAYSLRVSSLRRLNSSHSIGLRLIILWVTGLLGSCWAKCTTKAQLLNFLGRNFMEESLFVCGRIESGSSGFSGSAERGVSRERCNRTRYRTFWVLDPSAPSRPPRAIQKGHSTGHPLRTRPARRPRGAALSDGVARSLSGEVARPVSGAQKAAFLSLNAA
jgi:hypothetical protein